MEKTWKIREAELRAEIAEQIEYGSYLLPQDQPVGKMVTIAIRQAAKIAKGE